LRKNKTEIPPSFVQTKKKEAKEVCFQQKWGDFGIVCSEKRKACPFGFNHA
jgi:hypothetical protein